MTREDLIRGGCAFVASLMAATLFIGAETAADIPLFPAPFDKVVHFVYYGVMAALLAHALGVWWPWLALVFVPLIGAADEWQQTSIAGRDGSVWDWVANVMGGAIFVYGYLKWTKRRRRASK